MIRDVCQAQDEMRALAVEHERMPATELFAFRWYGLAGCGKTNHAECSRRSNYITFLRKKVTL